jgi:chromosome segregation ATPase
MSGNFDGNIKGLSAQDNTISNQENAAFNALLEKSQRTNLESKLQIARVGGYTKKSVEDFVAEMNHSLVLVKTQLERQIRDLAAEKASVIQECTVLRAQLKTAVETIASRNQAGSQQNDGEQYASGQEFDDQLLLNNKNHYEDLLKEKEAEIAQLNETLLKYQDDCIALKEKTGQLEQMLNNYSAVDQEMSELKKQKDEAEEKYRELQQKMEEANLELEQKQQYLDEKEAQLELRQQQIDETEAQLELRQQQIDETEAQFELKQQQMDKTEVQLELKQQQIDEAEAQLEQQQQDLDVLQMQLEKEKKYLKEARGQLDQKREQLDEIQLQIEQEKAHLEDTRVQLELKNQQLSEIQAKLESELMAREYIGNMMTNDYELDGSHTLEDWQLNNSAEKLFEALYVNYSQLKSKIEHQDSVIAEKEAQLEQLKNLENETAMLRKEHENAKETIASLKSSFEQVMAEMDEQTETLNLYISRSRKDRETLKTALSDRNANKSYNTEFLEQQNAQSEKINELEKENTQLEETVLKPYGQILHFDNAKRSIPLNNFSKEYISEDSDDEFEDSTMKDLTKAADI